ncbi:MAG: 5-oxoprolinase subunit PxpA [Candidatus Cryosericum sp.]
MSIMVDLNSDVGESFGAWRLGDDAHVLDYVSSANVACGFHAGDPKVMLTTVRLAHDRDVAVGAHPGYPDLAGFGRRAMTCAPDEIYAFCLYQIGALAAICHAQGISLSHVKAHGALYNQSARDASIARAVAQATRDAAPGLILLGLAGSRHEAAARDLGVPFAAEVFADRAYQSDGSLVARSQADSVLHDPEVIAARVISMVTNGTVETAQGQTVHVHADSVCVHGDNPAALAILKVVRRALDGAGVRIGPLREVLSL